MNPRWWLNLGLVAAIGGLAAILYFKPGVETPAVKPALSALTAETIQTLSVERPGQPPIVLEKTGTHWRLTAPFGARANPFRVDSLARVAAAESEARLPVEETALAQYGLAKPLLSVRFNDELLQFGAMHPLKQLLYVRYRDGIHLIGAHHFQPAAGRVNDFISTSLIEDGREPLALRLPAFTLTRANGDWKLAPENKELSSDRIVQFVQEWRHARALTVNRYEGKPYKEKVRLDFAGGTPGEQTTLEIGILARTPELILVRKDEGLQYHFPEDAGQRLLKISEK
jgi:hypothetical protein